MNVALAVRRIAALIIVAAACAAPPASARVGDSPLHQTVTAQQSEGLPPRVDGIASRPSERSARVAVPLVQASSNRGFDWASAAIGGAAILSLTLLGAAGWATVRARRTRPHRSRAA